MLSNPTRRGATGGYSPGIEISGSITTQNPEEKYFGENIGDYGGNQSTFLDSETRQELHAILDQPSKKHPKISSQTPLARKDAKAPVSKRS